MNKKKFFICLFIFLIVRQSLHDSTCIVALACVSNVSIIIVTTDEYKLVLCNKFWCSRPFCLYLTIHLCVMLTKWMWIQNLQKFYEIHCMLTYIQYFKILLRLSNVIAFPWFGIINIHDLQNAQFSSTPIIRSYINLDKITCLPGISSHFSKESFIYFRYWFAVRLKVIK